MIHRELCPNNGGVRKEIEKFISNNNIKTNVYRIQANDSTMCRYLCIRFINYILKGRV